MKYHLSFISDTDYVLHWVGLIAFRLIFSVIQYHCHGEEYVVRALLSLRGNILILIDYFRTLFTNHTFTKRCLLTTTHIDWRIKLPPQSTHTHSNSTHNKLLLVWWTTQTKPQSIMWHIIKSLNLILNLISAQIRYFSFNLCGMWNEKVENIKYPNFMFSRIALFYFPFLSCLFSLSFNY